MSKPKPKPNKKPLELFAIALGAWICPDSISRNSGDAITRFMMADGLGKYMDSGYDGMKKDGYKLVKIEANFKFLEKKKKKEPKPMLINPPGFGMH